MKLFAVYVSFAPVVGSSFLDPVRSSGAFQDSGAVRRPGSATIRDQEPGKHGSLSHRAAGILGAVRTRAGPDQKKCNIFCKKFGICKIIINFAPVNLINIVNMKSKKFVFDLDSKVSIYVPSTIEVNQTTDNRKQVERVIRELSTMFGGATASSAVGGWVAASGETVIEHVTIVYSFCTSEGLKNHIDDILNICESLKIEMSQEAITLEINGQVKFI